MQSWARTIRWYNSVDVSAKLLLLREKNLHGLDWRLRREIKFHINASASRNTVWSNSLPFLRITKHDPFFHYDGTSQLLPLHNVKMNLGRRSASRTLDLKHRSVNKKQRNLQHNISHDNSTYLSLCPRMSPSRQSVIKSRQSVLLQYLNHYCEMFKASCRTGPEPNRKPEQNRYFSRNWTRTRSAIFWPRWTRTGTEPKK